MIIAYIDEMLSNIVKDMAALYSRQISVEYLPENQKDRALAAWVELVANKENPESIINKLPYLLPLRSAIMCENRYTITLRYRFSREITLRSIVEHHIQEGTRMDEYTLLYLARMATMDMEAGLKQGLIYGLAQEAILVNKDTGKLIYPVYIPVIFANENSNHKKEDKEAITTLSMEQAISYSISKLGNLLLQICALSNGYAADLSEGSVEVPTIPDYVAIANEVRNYGYSNKAAMFIATCMIQDTKTPIPEGFSQFKTMEEVISMATQVLQETSQPKDSSTSRLSVLRSRTSTRSDLSSEEQQRSKVRELITSQSVKSLTEYVSSGADMSVLSSLLEDNLILARKQYSVDLEIIVQACTADKDLCIRVNAREPRTSLFQTYLISSVIQGDIHGIIKHYSEIGFIYGKYTALMEAARRNNFRAIKILLGELGYINSIGQTALMLATHFNNIEVARLLLMEVGIADNWGTTALMIACMEGHDAIAELLLPESRRQDEWGCTAMIYAAQYGHLNCVKILIPKELNLRTHVSTTALSHAMICGHMDCALALQDEFPQSNLMPLMYHAFFNTFGDALSQDIAEYSDTIHYANKAGFTAIMFAAAGNNWHIVNILLPYETQKMQELHAKKISEIAFSCLSDVIRAKNIHLTFVFARYIHYCSMTDEQSDVQFKTSELKLDVWDGIPTLHRTPLMEYAKRGDIIGVRAARNDYCKVFDGCTALMLAIINKMAICSRLLLPELGIRGAKGKTALMYAVETGQVDLVCLLLAEARIQNEIGQTALDIARQKALSHGPNSSYAKCVAVLSGFDM